VRYELYLRFESDRPRTRIGEALARTGFSVPTDSTSGLGRLGLSRGELCADPFRGSDWDRPSPPPATTTPAGAGPAGENLPGINFSFPLGLPDEDGDRAIGVILDLAEELTGVLYDPQLGAPVRRHDRERVTLHWRQSHSFQMDVVGAPDLGPGLPSAPPPIARTTGRIRALLVVAGILLVLVLALRSCVGCWLERAMVPEAQQDDDRRGGEERTDAR
jgi:hypothetical protein